MSKTLKRVLVVIMAAVLCLGTASTVFAAKTEAVVVSFDGNGATSNTFAPQTYITGRSGQKFVGTIDRPGYTFLGWSTAKNGTAKYSLNNAVSDSWIKKNAGYKVLYAVWQPCTGVINTTVNGKLGWYYFENGKFRKVTGAVKRQGTSSHLSNFCYVKDGVYMPNYTGNAPIVGATSAFVKFQNGKAVASWA